MSGLDKLECELRAARDLKDRQAEAVGHINNALFMVQHLGFAAHVSVTKYDADQLALHLSCDLFPSVADDTPVELVEPVERPAPAPLPVPDVAETMLPPLPVRELSPREMQEIQEILEFERNLNKRVPAPEPDRSQTGARPEPDRSQSQSQSQRLSRSQSQSQCIPMRACPGRMKMIARSLT